MAPDGLCCSKWTMQLLSHYVHLNPLSSSLCQGFTHALELSHYRKLKSLSHCIVDDDKVICA